MKASKYLLPTARENPQDAVIASHRLMLRAGLFRKSGSGLYHILPMGLRVIRKIENIVREEMNNAGALEFSLPILTPSELWKQSGRWDTMGKEMFRIQDRHEAWLTLGPTHEESFTDLMKGILKSYRDLPVNVYQIHPKFRDEIRPRFGVIRSREFSMKDAYSFDMDQEGLEITYQTMRQAYRKIFARTGLVTIPVEADTGAMGGTGSEEFMVPSDIGEETLLISEKGKYRGNQEKTPVVYSDAVTREAPAKANSTKMKLKKVHTPNCATIADLEHFLKIPAQHILKTMLYLADGRPVAVCLRADRNLNEVKLKNNLHATEVTPASAEEILAAGSVAGYIGPEGLDESIPIFWDESINTGREWVIGANEKDHHYLGYIAQVHKTVDLALAVGGDPSPAGDGILQEVKGIEVGHIFKLGYKYTKAFEMTVLDENGKPHMPIMGCYGIGVTRTMAAVIEQEHDTEGIVWPISVAPFEIVLVSITKSEEEDGRVGEFYKAMTDIGLEVFWDDRDLRPGVKFTDAELIGFPIRITMGKKYFEAGDVEVQIRRGKKNLVLKGNSFEILDQIVNIRKELFADLNSRMEQNEQPS